MVGAETIKPSDVMDMRQISAFLPFATYIVLDKSMARKVEEAKLDERYDVRVFTRRTLPALLDELRAIARAAGGVRGKLATTPRPRRWPLA
jgi:predicted transcriptional regulator